jgi:GST-like protein
LSITSREAPQDKYEVVQWVMWQMANQGPKFGERGHFLRAAQQAENGDLSYGRRRFDNEVNRLYGVLNNRLYDRRYLAGEHYSIVDIARYPWAINWALLKQDIEQFKYVKRWLEDVGARPAVQRGMDVGTARTVPRLPSPEIRVPVHAEGQHIRRVIVTPIVAVVDEPRPFQVQ